MSEITPRPEQTIATPDNIRESLFNCIEEEERKALGELANPNLGLSEEQ